MDLDKVRVIKFSRDALYEFIYEMLNERMERYFDVGPTEVSAHFDIDWEKGQFIYCVIQSEDEQGNFLTMPKGVDLQSLMRNLPDTTDSMFTDRKLYREYTKQELIDLSHSP